jgi:hypothetical protein
MSDELLKELQQLNDSLLSIKKNYESGWQDTAKYFLPTKTDITTQKTAGDNKDIFQLFDSTTVVALDNFANILNGTLTNKSSPWFKVSVQDDELKVDDNVKEWLDDVTKKIWNELYNPASNFEIAHYENLQAFGCFGNIAMKIEEGKNNLYNFKALHIRTYAINENDEGKVDTCILTMQMQARQIVNKFSSIEDVNIPEAITKANEKSPYDNFEIKLIIMPNKEKNPEKTDFLNMPFIGYWVDLQNKTIIAKTGFNTFPIAFGRGTKSSGEIYGVGRAILALADARTLNRMTSDYLEASEKSLKPPLIVNAEFEKQLDLTPLSTNYVRGILGQGRAVEPIIDTKGFQPTVELMLNRQESIRKIFFLDKLVVLDDPRATATQILELRAESYRIMGSIATSIAEYLENILNRCFDIIFKKSYAEDGLFSLMPDAFLLELPQKLQGKLDEITGKKVFPKFKVEFINPISQSQRSNQNNSIDAFVMSAMNMAQTNPAILDKLNFDKIIEVKSDILQIDPSLIRNDDDVEAIRNQRDQAMAQEQESLLANNEANTLKTMKEAGL